MKLLCSAVSQRRIALILGISRLTVARKFVFLGRIAVEKNAKEISKIPVGSLQRLYVDEMEDRIHTKCKPTAIGLVVTDQRRILGHSVSRIRPKNKGLLEITKRKYPEWTNNSKEKFNHLVQSISPLVNKKAEIRSDEKGYYQTTIKRHLPHSSHLRYASRRAVVAGQGELKQGGRDPLFALNHTCAMLRANINRLIRRTWCTSKTLEALDRHIAIYTHFHNNVLI